jgi:hypothetical protein
MALLTNEAKQSAKPFINFLWTLLIICVCVTLACNFIIQGWPPYVAWLKPVSNLVIVLGFIGVGILVGDRNKLVK